jgi:16S rRNA (guanine527-N7)-methyltransferase
MDVGSGAGFPGLVAACVRPDVQLTLVDSRQKACSFLDAASAQASLCNVRVVNERVEQLANSDAEAGSYGAVMSRGVDLVPLLESIRALTTPSGALFMMVSGRQSVPESELVGAGFLIASELTYTLPTGEGRRIVCYAPA